MEEDLKLLEDIDFEDNIEVDDLDQYQENALKRLWEDFSQLDEIEKLSEDHQDVYDKIKIIKNAIENENPQLLELFGESEQNDGDEYTEKEEKDDRWLKPSSIDKQSTHLSESKIRSSLSLVLGKEQYQGEEFLGWFSEMVSVEDNPPTPMSPLHYSMINSDGEHEVDLSDKKGKPQREMVKLRKIMRGEIKKTAKIQQDKKKGEKKRKRKRGENKIFTVKLGGQKSHLIHNEGDIKGGFKNMNMFGVYPGSTTFEEKGEEYQAKKKAKTYKAFGEVSGGRKNKSKQNAAKMKSLLSGGSLTGNAQVNDTLTELVLTMALAESSNGWQGMQAITNMVLYLQEKGVYIDVELFRSGYEHEKSTKETPVYSGMFPAAYEGTKKELEKIEEGKSGKNITQEKAEYIIINTIQNLIEDGLFDPKIYKDKKELRTGLQEIFRKLFYDIRK